MRGRRLVIGVATIVATAACSSSSKGATPSATTVPVASGTDAPADSPNWDAPGHELLNTRAASGSTINTSNVATLTPAWEKSLDGSVPTTPLVVDGRVYFTDTTGTVYAVDAKSGKIEWRNSDKQLQIGPIGVALGDGLVFATTPKGVRALDLDDGKEQWERTVTRTDTEGVDIAPQVAGSNVYISTVPISLNGQYRGGDGGVIYALDAATGNTRWTFDTVKGGDLWGNPEVNSGGGAWYPPAVDVDRNRVFFGIANPAPFPGTVEFPNGTSRPGPNLYTNSTVALDASTGKLVWYHQQHPHDMTDRDFVHAMLVDRPRGTRIVVGAGKGGVVVGMDEATGEMVWTRKVGIHRNDELKAFPKPTQVYPGTLGGILTPPSSADGIVYVATNNAPTTIENGRSMLEGGKLGDGQGEIVAINADDGSIVWDTKIDGDPLGGTAVVNDLVVTGTYQGKLFGLDRKTGRVVWTYDAGGGINGWMAAAGDMLFVPVSYSVPPKLLALKVR